MARTEALRAAARLQLQAGCVLEVRRGGRLAGVAGRVRVLMRAGGKRAAGLRGEARAVSAGGRRRRGDWRRARERRWRRHAVAERRERGRRDRRREKELASEAQHARLVRASRPADECKAAAGEAAAASGAPERQKSRSGRRSSLLPQAGSPHTSVARRPASHCAAERVPRSCAPSRAALRSIAACREQSSRLRRRGRRKEAGSRRRTATLTPMRFT